MATRSDDPLERAERAARELRDADDWDEPTGRTDVHVHLRESQHESDPPAQGNKLKWALRSLGAGIGTGLVVALATILQRCH